MILAVRTSSGNVTSYYDGEIHPTKGVQDVGTIVVGGGEVLRGVLIVNGDPLPNTQVKLYSRHLLMKAMTDSKGGLSLLA